MRKERRRRTIVSGSAIALVAVGAISFVAQHGDGAKPSGDADPDGRRAAGAEMATLALPPSLLSPDSPQEVGRRVAEALAEWRTAILTRDAEQVGKLDAAFLEAPVTYLEALKNSANSDENPHVRAFSTRELGKLKRADLTQTFERLLDDESPFVRKNAAWALGELGRGAETTRRTP